MLKDVKSRLWDPIMGLWDDPPTYVKSYKYLL